MEWWKLRGLRGREWWGGDWASSLFVVLCHHVVLVVFVVWASRRACVLCPHCRIVIVGVVGGTSLVGCLFMFVVGVSGRSGSWLVVVIGDGVE